MSIKKVGFNFTDYNCRRELEFTPGVNVISQPNGWGKSLMTNTIMSLYTGYFGKNKTLPSGAATIETDDGVYQLVKKNWIGSTVPDPLARYAIVGAFFNDTKSTVEQREIISKLLEIDRDGFINNYLNNYLKSLDDSQRNYYSGITLGIDTLKDNLKTAKNNEDMIIKDITRLKGEILSFKEQEFEDIKAYDKFLDYVKGVRDKHNKEQDYIKKENQDILASNKNIEDEKQKDKSRLFQMETLGESKAKELKDLREQYNQNLSAVCFNCGQAMKVPEDKNNSIKEKGIRIKQEIESLEKEQELLMNKTYKELGEIKEYNFLNTDEETIEHYHIKPVVITPERMQEYNDYKKLLDSLEFYKKELELKEKQLKEINTVQIQDCIGIINDAVECFNKDLEEKVKSTGLKIELFQQLKNGNIKQTFNIYNDDDKEYSECSSGQKMLIQVKLALLFVKKFGLKTILIDESSLIDKDNFDILCNELKDYQIIFFKATGF